jgi:hypothetical protein
MKAPVTSSKGRAFASNIAILLGVLLLALGALSSVVQRSFFDARGFAARTAASLSDPGVAAFAADRVTKAILETDPDLVAIRPLLVVTVSGVVSSGPFRALVATGAREAHRAVFSEGTQRVVLSLPDVEVLVRGALERASPELAEKIPEKLNTVLASLGDGWQAEFIVDLWRLGQRVRWQTELFLIAGPVLLLFGLWGATDRRRGLVRVGVALMVGGLAVGALSPAGRLAIGALLADPLERGAAQGLWKAYVGDLATWGLFFGGLGLLFAAATTSLLEAADPVARARRIGMLIIVPPHSRAGRVAWGALLFGIGALAVTFPVDVLAGAVVLIGVGAAYLGVRELFRVFLESVPVAPVAEVSRGPRWNLRAAMVLGVAGAVAVVWAVWRNPVITPVPTTIKVCNIHPELCERTVDQVVFAGTHNSMSHEKIPDWMFPHHQAGIPRQLRDGVRALLIDVYYGFPGGSRIKTDLGGVNRKKLEEALGPEGVAAAERIRDRLVGVDEGRRGLYLCHGFCELGAYELEPTLREIHDFLIQNPHEVLLIIVEDYVEPQDLASAFQRSGLADLVYRGMAYPQWPTLRGLIASGQRVIVFVESGRLGVPWLRPAFRNFQETPYSFHKPEEFSCRPNRGGTDGTLFLLNHWIDTAPAPRPSNAAIVNPYDFLLRRARGCSHERARLPNVLAVDFYQTGDLFRVVDELNGVGDESSS